MGRKKTERRTIGEYHRALASLTAEDAAVALATYVFSAIDVKRRCVEAMHRIEQEPGFAGWGTFRASPVGPAVKVQRPPRGTGEGGRG